MVVVAQTRTLRGEVREVALAAVVPVLVLHKEEQLVMAAIAQPVVQSMAPETTLAWHRIRQGM